MFVCPARSPSSIKVISDNCSPPGTGPLSKFLQASEGEGKALLSRRPVLSAFSIEQSECQSVVSQGGPVLFPLMRVLQPACARRVRGILVP